MTSNSSITPEGASARRRTHAPSGKLVLYVLDHCGPLTTAELCRETRLAESTVRDALCRLRSNGLVTARLDGGPGRNIRYAATTER